jgi:nitroimidazol reductase NimA-like FMN-containing flavoprotein (pyridoxamine 5'-phosphate oxidase superfamily)
VETDRNGLEILDRRECMRLLCTQAIGRVAITSGALPTVLPVNFRVVDGKIVFRTGHGTKLAAATRNTVVAFEVDHVDRIWHDGWSVVVTGVARPVTDPDELAEMSAELIPRWVAGESETVAISADIVSGRRIVPGGRPPR